MYPPDADKKEKRGLRKRAKYIVLFGGKLHLRRSIYINSIKPIIIIMHAVIQILFVEEREHWVVSSFTNGKLKLYDSCSTGGLTSSLQVQLAQIYGDQFAVNKVYIEPVQQQEGEMDCGVFSIANAYTMLHMQAKSTKDVTYDSHQMRSHIQHCFEAKTFSPFPPSQNSASINRCDPRQIVIELYCTCGLPWRITE